MIISANDFLEIWGRGEDKLCLGDFPYFRRFLGKEKCPNYEDRWRVAESLVTMFLITSMFANDLIWQD